MADTATSGDKVTLYWLEQSRAQSILWLLEELQAPYELETFRRRNMLAPPEAKNIHPLGKFPILSIETDNPAAANDPDADKRKKIVLAESASIIEYLCDHFDGAGKGLVPPRYAPGMEGKLAGEAEGWMRYRYCLHYAEGSLMAFLVMRFVVHMIHQRAPFIVKPITKIIVSQADSFFLNQQLDTHFSFLESQLKTAPDGGPYLCGSTLTAADILMSFPIIMTIKRGLVPRAKYPAVNAYVDKLQGLDSYKRAIAKGESLDSKLTKAS